MAVNAVTAATGLVAEAALPTLQLSDTTLPCAGEIPRHIREQGL